MAMTQQERSAKTAAKRAAVSAIATHESLAAWRERLNKLAEPEQE